MKLIFKALLLSFLPFAHTATADTFRADAPPRGGPTLTFASFVHRTMFPQDGISSYAELLVRGPSSGSLTLHGYNVKGDFVVPGPFYVIQFFSQKTNEWEDETARPGSFEYPPNILVVDGKKISKVFVVFIPEVLNPQQLTFRICLKSDQNQRICSQKFLMEHGNK